MIGSMIGSGEAFVKGSVAYVPQQAWIRNATVQQNILMSLPFDKHKYQRVLRKCALLEDMKVLGVCV